MWPIAHHSVRPRAALVLAVAAALGGCGGDSGGQARKPPPAATPSATPSPAAGREMPAGPARTHDEVVRALVGRRIRVEGRRIRVDRDTVACGGIGRAAAHVRGKPAWRRFRCIQPTFPHGAVAGPDLVFVLVSAPDRLVVEQARLTSY